MSKLHEQLEKESAEFFSGFRVALAGHQRIAPYELHTKERTDWLRGWGGGRYVKDNIINFVTTLDELTHAYAQDAGAERVKDTNPMIRATRLLRNIQSITK